jgi:hypothetical protein
MVIFVSRDMGIWSMLEELKVQTAQDEGWHDTEKADMLSEFHEIHHHGPHIFWT